jgi:hypothetical protein
MAVGVVLEFDGGATLDQYDEVVKLMGLEPGGNTPPGALFHWVTKTGGGVRVTDVWKSREEFDKFAEEKIGPLSAQAGLGEPTKVEFFDVHNYFIDR